MASDATQGVVVVGIVMLALVALGVLGGVIWRRRRGSRDKTALSSEPDPNQELSLIQRVQLWQVRQAYARTAYRAARGTQHRDMLQRAHAQYKRALQTAQEAAVVNQRKAFLLKQSENDAFNRALSDWIVENHLDKVRGIGQVRRDQLIKKVYRGQLQDLTRASAHMRGIGSVTQNALNNWVREYQRRLPQLRQEDFPGKAAIIEEYAEKRAAVEEEVKQREAQVATLTAALNRIEAELAWLKTITPQRFRRSLSQPDPEVDRYLRGVFAEWEEVPAWFAEAAAFEA